MPLAAGTPPACPRLLLGELLSGVGTTAPGLRHPMPAQIEVGGLGGPAPATAGAIPLPPGAPQQVPVAGGAADVVVELDPREVAADSIAPGCAQFILDQWQPAHTRPMKKHLEA